MGEREKNKEEGVNDTYLLKNCHMCQCHTCKRKG